MFTALDVTLVLMVILVFPAPRWAELTTIWMQLKIIPPMIILKYCTARPWVSSLEPQNLIMGLAKKTKYYVQVRTYTKYGSKNYYSEWSLPKAVKTK